MSNIALKYLHIAKTSFLNRSYYRFEIFFDSLKAMVVVLVINSIWTQIYAHGNRIEGYTLSQIVTYTILASVLTLLFNVDLAHYMSRKVLRGEIAMELIKPVNYFMYCFCEHLGGIMYTLVFSVVPVFVLLAFVFRMDDAARVMSAEFLVMAPLGFVLYYMFCHICSLTTFYTIEAWGIEYMRINLIRFFAGGFLPLSAFPDALKSFSECMPFQYMIYQPVRAASGTFPPGQLAHVVMMQVVWIAVLLIVDQLLWRAVVRKITVYGG